MSQFVCSMCGEQADPAELASHEGMCLTCWEIDGDSDE